MNVFKKTAFIAALFLGVTVSVSAQQKDSTLRSPEARAKALTDKMKTELSLTDEQYSKVYDINLKYAQKNRTALKTDGSRMQKARTFRAGSKEKDTELKEVLTPEQVEKYNKLAEERKASLREAGKKRRGQRAN